MQNNIHDVTSIPEIAKYILLTEIQVLPQDLALAVECWRKSKVFGKTNSVLYSYENNLLEIMAIEDLSDLQQIFLQQEGVFQNEMKKIMLSDWKKQLLSLKEIVKPHSTNIPMSKYLQLRHIEVPAMVYPEYLEWRRNTIFKHILNHDEVESFTAYHSEFSTEPGVMFFSGFNSDVDEYSAIFKKQEYLNIIQEAGNKYIAGGKDCLYTKIYTKVDIS